MTLKEYLGYAFFISFCTAFSMGAASQQANKYLSDELSNPETLQLMKGFPPPHDKRVTLPDSNFFSFPKLRWSVCNMRALLPTAAIKRNAYFVNVLPYKPLAKIESLVFNALSSTNKMTVAQSLSTNYTDGLLVIHNGNIVYEKYRGCLKPDSNHAAMSMTKSLTGLLAEILIAQGKLDETELVKNIIPELSSSGFGDATVRQVMDMTTSIFYSENYADPQADIWRYSYAANPLPKPASYKGPVGYFEYLQTIKKDRQHGREFGYKTVNSDVLGWIIARTTGMKYDELASELVWSKLGMEYSADITVDALGTPFAGGGMSATLRDLARLGLAVLNHGKVNGMQMIPTGAIASIRRGGDKKAFSKAHFAMLNGGSYRSMWWHFHNKHGAFAARGVHGQTIYIDPTANMVLVRLASHPSAANSVIDPTSLPAYQAIAEYLLTLNSSSE